MIESTQNNERPIKHQKIVKESDDEEEIISKKRTTTTSTNRKGPIVKESEDEESGSDSESESGSESGSGSESESESDSGSDSDDSDAENTKIREEAELRKLSTDPEAGIIESITLENFMCHRHFHISFGSNVNFISGENGSGKSAVMIALIIALGAKASFTNRGSKITDLIRTDTNHSLIKVVLRNRGPEAYQPEKYGNSIVIERRINRNGGSGYKIKDHTGKVTISEKFTELSLILEQFNIQIDNPMSILTQDTSRQFLNSATASEKYKLFLTATQLDKMTKDYTATKENIDRINNHIIAKAQVCSK
ncbi:hypothetical protein DICPUDRAFT_39291 [Dictyostelium purpureum]|uniref:Rad50/SbcC-type AAA domain-containing protein n=1 Tax=Dictyostelium purpureum TaxID=5786 RepID=F0ZW21_DICPU|nr:uncharacterized protein DICPUDRAFT_39291 [Dictyostelium purpureum]EGC31844.1 hypothetical protein DICPUDRAFT_39291 [Dictyostelium purpureum]|eukprot:XP_003291614.1 hypothetical protein DICPUDRAFT_39291 [Dictyostelium purpureum]